MVLEVSLDLDFDGAWYTWAGSPRPLTVLADELSLQLACKKHHPSACDIEHSWLCLLQEESLYYYS